MIEGQPPERWALSYFEVTLLLMLIAVVLPTHVFADDQNLSTEPSDYRLSDYRGPVPVTVAGASVIETPQQLQDLLKAKNLPVLFDVYPAPPRPENIAPTDLWIEPRRETLPDATWLANVGMGVLTPPLEALFKQQLMQHTQGDKDHVVVIFCEPQCWHSWNAAKRAASFGYPNIYWYRQGVDGWRKANLPLQQKEPVRP